MTDARILVVEDDAIVAASIERRLERLGYRVPATAYSGEEAVQKAEETRPDLVLMDITLRGEVDGVEAAREIRARFGTPVVYLTGYADDRTLRRAMDTEPLGYVLKPFESSDLRSSIEIALHRHRMIEDLRRREERFRALVESSWDIVVVVGEDGTIRYRSPTRRSLGYDLEDMIGAGSGQFVHPDDLPEILEAFNEILQQPDVVRQVSCRVRDKDGVWHFVEAVGKNLLDHPAVEGIVVTVHDVTEARQAEEALRRQHALVSRVMETSPVCIVLVDREGRITFANPRAREVLGLSAGETVRSVYADPARCIADFDGDPLPPERLPFRRVTDARKPLYDMHSAVRWTDGRCVYLSVSGAPLFDESGRLDQVVLTIEDATRHVEAQKALERYAEQLRTLAKRLAEAGETERQQIARELHDRVGQNLTALGINLNIVRSLVPEGVADAARARLDDSLALVEETTERIRGVMAELRPPVLDDYGLLAALRWHGEHFARRMDVAITVEGESLDPRLPASVESALFRIAQEALTNVAKHAEATQASVTLEADEECVRLTVADDGIGFEDTERPRTDDRGGWGLLSMFERAGAVGGRCRIESPPEGGTRVIVEVDR